VRDTIACISGATDGIGNVLAKTVPWPGARIINLSRRDHPDFENVRVDLTKPKPILQLRRAAFAARVSDQAMGGEFVATDGTEIHNIASGSAGIYIILAMHLFPPAGRADGWDRFFLGHSGLPAEICRTDRLFGAAAGRDSMGNPPALRFLANDVAIDDAPNQSFTAHTNAF